MSHSSNTVSGSHERRLATIAAGYASDPESLAALTAALGEKDPLVRAAALGGLHRRNALGIEAVIVSLGDRSPIVRQRAAQLAPEATGDAAERASLQIALRRALHDPVPLSVVVALEAIGNLGDVEATDEVLAIAASTADPLVLEEAIATLASLGDPRGLPVVLAASAGKPALRRRSVAALGAFEGAEVEAALDRLGDDRDWQVRQAVAMLRREELDEVPPDDDDA